MGFEASINPSRWFIFYCGDVRPIGDNEFKKIKSASVEFFEYIEYLLRPLLSFYSAKIVKEGIEHVFVPFTIIEMIEVDRMTSNVEAL